MEWLSAVTDLPLSTPAALSVLQIPVSRGGLGFLNPQYEGALHYLQAALPLAGEHATTDEEETFHRSLADTLPISHHATIDLAQAVAHLEPKAKARRVRELSMNARPNKCVTSVRG